ncbi:M56 family metallopeptidase [Lacinutrix sp.]|uniref:M56 family metallopeptidase n=1 Tax=Lacinutrix sp. TaxID=1937692 RepID=UPI0025B80B78|nr:M56 family metallopeptidase [Lacinutrix sp.]
MDYFLKASVVVIIFYCCYKLFLQRETFFQYNRWFLLTGLFLATVLPLVVIPIYIEYTPTPINFIESTTVVSQVQSQVVNSITFLEVLFYLYLIGLAYFFGRLVLQFKSLQALLHKESKVKKDSFYFIETEKSITPFSFFNHIVFNPEQYTRLELSHIITHEKVHAKQLHSLDMIITQIATVLFWFNPFIWWYKREIQQNLEFIADYNAQKEISCSKSYQTVLLKASINQSELVLPNYFYQSLIKKRIIMLQKSKSKKSRLLKLTIVLPVLALFLMSFNVEERYVAKTVVYENEVNTEDFIITSKSTDKEIEAISVKLEAQTDGLKIKFSNLKRNINGAITNLSIETKANDKTAFTKHITYKHKEGKPIGNIVLKVENNELIFGYVDIGMNMKVNKDGSTTSFLSKKASVKQEMKTNAGAIQVQNSVDNTVVKVSSDKNNDVLIMSSLSDGSVEIITQNSDGNLVKNGTVFSSNNKNVLNGAKQFTMITSQTSKDGKLINENIKIVNANKLNDTINFEPTNLETSHFKTSVVSKNKPIVFINGIKSTKEELKNLKPDSFESVTVLKDKSAKEKYGFEGVNGVVEIITKKNDPTKNKINIIDSINPKKIIMTFPNGDLDASNNTFISKTSTQDLVYIVIDGKESNKQELSVLDPDKIKSMNVLKHENAITLYGEKGKDGVIIVTTKKENPWDISYQVSEVSFEDKSVKEKLHLIDKNSSDMVLEHYKSSLKNDGIIVSYSKLRRNSNGEIKSIKIDLKDDNGNKSSATWKRNKDVIPKIWIGKSNGSLIASSSL